ncbi:MAG TPA: hypothetical protein VHM28_06325 [Anaerolineales bacterium]|nr:hypothetical protein [Anaerolineales bacterium]
MKYYTRLSGADKYKLEGSFWAFVSTLPGSLMFVVVVALVIYRDDPMALYESFTYWTLGFIFLISLFLSFIPAVAGGWILATWISTDQILRTRKSGTIKGLICGATAMFSYDFALGLLSLPSPHGPSLNMFMFYVILSTIIAGLAGAVVGIKLIRKIVKVNE